MPDHSRNWTYDLFNALPKELRGQIGSSTWYFGTESSCFNMNLILSIMTGVMLYLYRWEQYLWCYPTLDRVQIMVQKQLRKTFGEQIGV